MAEIAARRQPSQLPVSKTISVRHVRDVERKGWLPLRPMAHGPCLRCILTWTTTGGRPTLRCVPPNTMGPKNVSSCAQQGVFCLVVV